MNNTPMAPEKVRAEAMSTLRNVLDKSPGFLGLDDKGKAIVYDAMLTDEITKRTNNALVRSMATDSGKDMGYKGYDPGFGGDTKAFKDLVDSVDFPKFVADLLKAVFDANLTVMKTQTDSYIKLMKEATKSSADFIKKVKDEESFARLAESKGDKYNVITERQPDGSSKLALTTPEGEKHDVE